MMKFVLLNEILLFNVTSSEKKQTRNQNKQNFQIFEKKEKGSFLKGAKIPFVQ